MSEWTKEPPTEAGFYWLRQEGERDTIVRIDPLTFSTWVMFIGTDEDMLITSVGGLWYGPLQPPEDE